MDTPKYNGITSMLDSSDKGFDDYVEMSKRIDLFVETGGASELGGVMEEDYIARYAALQDRLYKQALEKKKNRSC